MRKTVKLARLSICPCGFPVLEDHIEVGSEYVIHPDTIDAGFTYRCGECGHEQKIAAVLVDDIFDLRSGYMPVGLFDLEASA